MSKGGSGTKLPQGAHDLAARQAYAFKAAGPARNQIFQQLAEGLSTGGINAKIPIIQQMISSSNQANAAALQQTSEQLTAKNIGGPFAASILAGQRQQGYQQNAAIGPQVVQQMINQAPSLIPGLGTVSAGSLGSESFTNPDTASPAVAAGGAIVAAAIVA